MQGFAKKYVCNSPEWTVVRYTGPLLMPKLIRRLKTNLRIDCSIQEICGAAVLTDSAHNVSGSLCMFRMLRAVDCHILHNQFVVACRIDVLVSLLPAFLFE
jgi:hypothetical protein